MYQANLAAAHLKARALNNVLPRLQDEFEAALNRGVILELESGLGLVDEFFREAGVGV